MVRFPPPMITHLYRFRPADAVLDRYDELSKQEIFLRRLRNGGQQYVRVEHVHVNDGGQAVIGNVKKSNA